MTQLIFKIEDQSLVPLLKGIGKHLKGVTILTKPLKTNPISISSTKMTEGQYKKRLKRRAEAINELSKKKFDAALIDLSDDRTRYLMSK